MINFSVICSNYDCTLCYACREPPAKFIMCPPETGLLFLESLSTTVNSRSRDGTRTISEPRPSPLGRDEIPTTTDKEMSVPAKIDCQCHPHSWPFRRVIIVATGNREPMTDDNVRAIYRSMSLYPTIELNKRMLCLLCYPLCVTDLRYLSLGTGFVAAAPGAVFPRSYRSPSVIVLVLTDFVDGGTCPPWSESMTLLASPANGALCGPVFQVFHASLSAAEPP